MEYIKFVDCVRISVPSLEKGIEYYVDGLGFKLLWRTKDSVGLGMSEDKTELVLSLGEKIFEVDFRVESVEETIIKIKELGGQVIYGPFDIDIGKCAIVEDIFSNRFVILDISKGLYVTDDKGNVIGVEKSE